jgi:hypothetical protein
MAQNVPRVVDSIGTSPRITPQRNSPLKWFHDFKTMPQNRVCARTRIFPFMYVGWPTDRPNWST